MWALAIKILSVSPNKRESISNYHLIAAMDQTCTNPSLLFIPFVMEMLLLYHGVPIYIPKISQVKLIRGYLISDLEGCMKLLNLVNYSLKDKGCSTCVTLKGYDYYIH